MKPVPIYDATAPISCTLGEHEVADRVELVERLRISHTARERTEHGLVLTFPNRPDIDDDVRRFAAEEKRCCAFWGFDVTTHADMVVLRWDGPPDAADIIDRFDAYFARDADLDVALRGML